MKELGSDANKKPKDFRSGDVPLQPAATGLMCTHPQELSATTMEGIEQHESWNVLSRIPMMLNAIIPLPRFRVRDLVGLKPGSIVLSEWPSGDDVLMTIGEVHCSWCEFEVVEHRMAVRMTRLA